MCTNRKFIINSRGQRLAVNCGHCPSCLQEKAIKRAQRIRNNANSDMMTLFVTLTYRNAAVPYFDADEFNCAPIHRRLVNIDEDGKDEYEYVKYLSVYRNIVARRDYKNKFKYHRTLLTGVEIPYPFGVNDSRLKALNGYNSKTKKVGVCYYPDLQNFLKRLRQNLKRKYHVSDNFEYYACSEYGAKSNRPHFHLLLFVPRSPSCFSLWQRAISEAWPFDGYNLTKRNIEIAINAASYVSTYVNCTTYLPEVFTASSLKPKHSYSQGFGCALKRLSIPQVCEAFRRGDLFCDVPVLRDKSFVMERVLLPRYVVNRYFPKFKGFSLLSCREIESICARPETIRIFRTKCCYSDADCHKIVVMLTNKQKLFARYGLDKYEFARIYPRIWSLYASSVYRCCFEGMNDPLNNFYQYDNLSDFCDGSVASPTLLNLSLRFAGRPLITDINAFPPIVQKTEKMEKYFHLYDKARKVSNSCYTHFNNHY